MFAGLGFGQFDLATGLLDRLERALADTGYREGRLGRDALFATQVFLYLLGSIHTTIFFGASGIRKQFTCAESSPAR